MAISNELRKFLTNGSIQQLLTENDLTRFLNAAHTMCSLEDFRKLVDLLSLKYEDMFGDLNGLLPGMFKDTLSVHKVSLNGTVESIPSQCFEHSNLSIIEGQNVKTLSAKCFYECNNLTTVDFPNLEVIGSGTFNNCKSLKVIDLPKTLTKVSSKAFGGCTSLEKINYHGTKEECQKVQWMPTWDGTFDNTSGIKIVCTDGVL